jgi:hypothetical protein
MPTKKGPASIRLVDESGKRISVSDELTQVVAEWEESTIYLFGVPDKRDVPPKCKFIPEMAEFTINWPPGWILAHNQVRPTGFPKVTVEQDGFRAWFARPDTSSNYVRCRCGWAPHLGTHYRVRRS